MQNQRTGSEAEWAERGATKKDERGEMNDQGRAGERSITKVERGDGQAAKAR